MTDVREGRAPSPLQRGEFSIRFRDAYRRPAFDTEADAIGRLEEIAWQADREGRKASSSRKAGPRRCRPRLRPFRRRDRFP
jgi:hypothetical protein